MELQHPPLYLASKSPRRQALLTEAGIAFQRLDLDVPEDFPEDMAIEDVPLYLARKKAEAAIPMLTGDALVLTADSIVIMNDTIFGKPADEAEAFRMIEMLSGHPHLVITGVFIGNKQRAVGFSDFTSVWMAKMEPEEIWYYIRRQPPMDKAGSYGIQDWIGWTKVSRIEGSYANVMGLPIQRVYEVLRNWHSDENTDV